MINKLKQETTYKGNEFYNKIISIVRENTHADWNGEFSEIDVDEENCVKELKKLFMNK